VQCQHYQIGSGADGNRAIAAMLLPTSAQWQAVFGPLLVGLNMTAMVAVSAFTLHAKGQSGRYTHIVLKCNSLSTVWLKHSPVYKLSKYPLKV